MGDLWSLLTRRSSASGRLFKRLDSISSRLFYRHGLFCASHPYLTLFFSFVLMFFLSSPVILQLYGHLTQPPQPVPTLLWETSASHFSSGLSHVKEKFGTEPYLRLEQIVVNVTGLPSDGGSDRGVLSDSILAYAMSLHEAISRTVVDGSSGGLGNQKKFSLADICYMPPGIERCLVHSPLEYWGSESERFAKDVDHLATVSDSSILSSLGIPIPLESVFSGLRFDAASRKVIGAESLLFTYFLSSKPPEEQLQARIPDVWDRLWTEAFKSTRHFTTSIGASEALKPTEWRSDGAPRLLYYEFGSSTSIFTGESLVLGVMYIIVFLYISLVLGKVDLVKSKFALGFGAVITVFTGLVMSVGLCSFLGVQTSLVPWEALPFLLIVVGMENIFVLTNSVVMTSLDLPVKERVGIGLSKVGASMTASLGGEMCLLLLASLTSIPTLQEFCLFGAVSLVMDYFMQITFFVTILSIDIRRLELSDLHNVRSVGGNLTGRRASTATTGAVDSESTAEDSTESEQSPSQRPHWGSYLIILALVSVLGLGLSGSSTSSLWAENSISATVLGKKGLLSDTSCENSVCSTANAFWHIIDPDRSAKYVEIGSPQYVSFETSSDRSFAKPDVAYQPSPSSSSLPFPSSGYASPTSGSLASSLQWVQHAHPVFFMIVVVLSLLLFVVVCLFISSLAQWASAAASGQSLRRDSVASEASQASSSPPESQSIDGSAIDTVPAGGCEDVEYLISTSDFVVWIQGGGQRVRYMNKADPQQTFAVGRVRNRSRITTIAVHKVSEKAIWIASGTDSGSVEVWDASAKVFLLEDGSLPKGRITTLAFGPGGADALLFAGTADGSLKVIFPAPPGMSIGPPKRLPTYVCRKHSGAILTLHVDSYGTLYSASEDSTIKCWSARRNGYGSPEWIPFHTFFGHQGHVTALASDQQGRILASGASTGELIIWDVERRSLLVKIVPGDTLGSEAPSGHNGPVTQVYLTQTSETLTSTTHMICSAAKDEEAIVWEYTSARRDETGQSANRNRSTSAPPPMGTRAALTRRDSFASRDPVVLSKQQITDLMVDESQNALPPASLRQVGRIRQTGAVNVAMAGTVLFGVCTRAPAEKGESRTQDFGNYLKCILGLPNSQPPSKTDDRRDSKGWVWTVWMVDVRTWKGDLSELQTVVIGEDKLKGLGSDPLLGVLLPSPSASKPPAESGVRRRRVIKATREPSSDNESYAVRKPPRAPPPSNQCRSSNQRRPDSLGPTSAPAAMGRPRHVRAGSNDHADVLRTSDHEAGWTGSRDQSVPRSATIGKPSAPTPNLGRDLLTSPMPASSGPQDQTWEDQQRRDAKISSSDSGSGHTESSDLSSASTVTNSSDDSSSSENDSDIDDPCKVGWEADEAPAPVLQVRSLSASDSGVAVAFGNCIKLISMTDRAGSAGERRSSLGSWRKSGGDTWKCG